MRRRDFFTSAVATTAALSASCNPEQSGPEALNIITRKKYEWIMVTTWPPGFPILHEACVRLADQVRAMSSGRLNIKVYGAGELIPAFECFEAVSLGTAALASGASYYWAGKIPSAQFFAALPFGLNAQGMNAWILQGGGLEVWREIYADFNLLPFPGGNTGVQMAGWFNKELVDISSFKGLKMRIPGLGGKVFERAGGTTLLSPGNEVYTNLERGVIDATEWIGPYHDYLMGFHEVAKYYYGPGWHEPGTVLEMIVHKPTLERLPTDLQAIVETAIHNANSWTLEAFEAKNGEYINKLKDYGTDIRMLPQALINSLRPIAKEVIEEVADQDAFCRKAYDSYSAFAKTYKAWTTYSEQAYWTNLQT
jgi:TRAP-type mannitol/chloroaromatic compound transport system substrate-binding protein